MSKIITFVVPVASGGVYDYTNIIMRGLSEAGFDVRIFVWNKSRAAAIDAHIAESDCLYLQYSGYGYSKRGAPLWMLSYLNSRRSSIRNFGIFFHELYAFGSPFGSAFWLSPVQRHIAASLARMADFWFTNREQSQRWLQQQAPNIPHATLPTISNVGELLVFNSIREPIAVVFGGSSLRHKTWRMAENFIFDWATENGLTLHDIGPSMQDPELEKTLNRHKVFRHGLLDAVKVGQILANSTFGIVSYPVEYVAKSGVFAAYCAHGVTPILISEKCDNFDGLVAGQHYFNVPSFKSAEFFFEDKLIGKSAWLWYFGHSNSVHIKVLINNLN